jgi:hypothetical protein
MSEEESAALWELVGDLVWRVLVLESMMNFLLPAKVRNEVDGLLTAEYIRRFCLLTGDNHSD